MAGIADFEKTDAVDLASACLVLWAALSLAWSPDPLQGILCLSRLAMLWVVFVAARRIEIDPTAVVTLAAAIVLLDALIWSRYGGFGNRNDLSEFAAIAFILALRRDRYIPFAITGLCLTYALSTGSRIAIVGLAGAFVAWVVSTRHWKFLAILAVLPALYFAWGWSANGSIAPRMQIWMAAIHMWMDYPMGVGLGQFEWHFPDYMNTGIHSPLFDHPFTRPGAVHNDFIQLLTELGVIGFSLGAYIVGRAFVLNNRADIVRTNPAYSFHSAALRGYTPALGSLLALGLVDFPFQKASLCTISALVLGRSLCLNAKTHGGNPK